MHTTRRSTHSFIVLLALLLGMALVAPAGIAAQDVDDDPPDCDDEGWRIVITEDGNGFASEDHCDDHVADNGEDSLVEVGASEKNEYVVVTMTEAIGPSCKTIVTLVGGQDGQVVQAHITAASDAFFQPTFIPASGDTTHSALIRQGDSLVSGTAEFLDADFNPTGETLPVYLPDTICD